MKHVVVMAVASLIATSANAAEMKWSGSTGWRYDQTKHNDNRGSTTTVGTAQKGTSEQTTKTHAIRANLGVTGGWDNVEWGFGARTGGLGTINDDHVTLQNNGDRSLGIEQAWFRYVRDFGALDFNVTIGRQKNVFAYDTVSQNFFDNDVRWDGFGWQFKFGMFGLNAGQYITGARSSAGAAAASSFSRTDATEAAAATTAKFNYMFGFQPHMNWKFSDEIETMFAVGYYVWSDSFDRNQTNGGVTDYNGGTTNVATNPLWYSVGNPRQWQFLNTWTLPYNLSFNAELVLNKKEQFRPETIFTTETGSIASYGGAATTRPEITRTAWTAGLTYGSLKKAHDFTLGYAYGSKGLGAVSNRYTYEKFKADNKGHTINVGYAVADNFHIGWKGLFLKEKEMLDASIGRALTNSQNMKTSYWELTAGVMF